MIETRGADLWFHADRAREANGPLGTTIAHAYLTPSLVLRLLLPLEGGGVQTTTRVTV